MNACMKMKKKKILFLGGFSSSCTCFFGGQPLFLFGHSLVAPVEATKAQAHGFGASPPPLSLLLSPCVAYPMLLLFSLFFSSVSSLLPYTPLQSLFSPFSLDFSFFLSIHDHYYYLLLTIF